jgi:branched-chain amino acid transport system permease protein
MLATTNPDEAYRRSAFDARVQGGDTAALVLLCLEQAIAGLGGALLATSSYAITPGEFGFHMLVAALAMVVLGGRTTVWGALVGAAILTTLPELFRVFADYRNVVQGILLMVVIIYLPRGVADTAIAWARDRRMRRAAQAAGAAAPARAVASPANSPIEAGARS